MNNTELILDLFSEHFGVCRVLNKLTLRNNAGDKIQCEWATYDKADLPDILDRFGMVYPTNTEHTALVWTHVDTFGDELKGFDDSYAMDAIHSVIENARINFTWYGEGSHEAIMVYVSLLPISEIGPEVYMSRMQTKDNIISFQNDDRDMMQGYTLFQNQLLYFEIDLDAETHIFQVIDSQSHVWNTFQEWQSLIDDDYGQFTTLPDEYSQYMHNVCNQKLVKG